MSSKYITLSSRAKDITGKRFGKLVALGPVATRKKKGAKFRESHIVWEFQCDCGNKTQGAHTHRLKHKSCGCARRDVPVPTLPTPVTFLFIPPTSKNLTARRFGRLVALGAIEVRKYGSRPITRWLCVCDCGKITKVWGTNLLCGGTKSCGCALKNSRGEKKYMKEPVVREWDGKTYLPLHASAQDLTGKTIGRLTPLGPIKKTRSKARTATGTDMVWLCQCACGNKHEVRAHHLLKAMNKRGKGVLSCGCHLRHVRGTSHLPGVAKPKVEKVSDFLRWKAQRNYWLPDDEPERECAKAT